MRYLVALFILFQLNAKTQNLLLPDTHKIVRHLVELHDSIIKKVNAPIEIRDYNTLESYLKPLSRYQYHAFDFSKQYIGLDWVCEQCVRVCHHIPGEPNEPCHRNACQYSPRWAVKERTNTHKLDVVQVDIKGFSPLLQENKRKDTLIIHEKNLHLPLPENAPEYIYLYSNLGGDCHAHFTYELFQDDDKKTITWIIHNHYGGCRAGYYGEVYLRIKNPGAGYRFVFNEVLEERY